MEIVVYEQEAKYASPFRPAGAPEQPFWAIIASNPQMRTSGSTEKEAVEKLKHLIREHLHGYESYKVINISTEDIMNGI